MKRLLIITFIFGSMLVAGSVNAQMMGGFSNISVDWNEVVILDPRIRTVC